MPSAASQLTEAELFAHEKTESIAESIFTMPETKLSSIKGLRVITANINCGQCNDLNELCAEFHQADVVLIQEDAMWIRGSRVGSVGRLCQATLDMQYYRFCETHRNEDGSKCYGVSVLSNAIIDAKSVNSGGNKFDDYMQYTGRVSGERKQLLIKFSDAEVLCVHLPSGGRLSESLLNTNSIKPDIIIGDFNTLPWFTKLLPASRDCRSDSSMLKKHMKDNNYNCAIEGVTFPSMNCQLDWVFSKSSMKIISSKIIETKASDHNFLLISL
jgi:endonuclease/exonuclease/phosphatase family metal-dependent hydrolase